jgi:hypothetical protein
MSRNRAVRPAAKCCPGEPHRQVGLVDRVAEMNAAAAATPPTTRELTDDERVALGEAILAAGRRRRGERGEPPRRKP